MAGPKIPHKVFPEHEADEVFYIQIQNVNRQKITEFVSDVTLDTIRGKLAKDFGVGQYTLVPYGKNKKNMAPFRTIEIEKEEVALARGGVFESSAGVDSAALQHAYRQLDQLRNDLRERQQQIESREKELTQRYAQREIEIQERIDTVTEDTQGRITELTEEYEDRIERLQAEIDAERTKMSSERTELYKEVYDRQEAIINDAQARADELEAKAENRASRIIAEAREDAEDIRARAKESAAGAQKEWDELKQRERELDRRERQMLSELATERAKIEREMVEYRMKVDAERMRAEMQIELAKVKGQNQSPSPWSKSVMDEYARAMIRQKFPEESEIEKWARQLAPLLSGGLMSGGMPSNGQYPDMTDDESVDLFGDPDDTPLPGAPPFPELPSLPSVDEQLASMPPVGKNAFADSAVFRQDYDREELVRSGMPEQGKNKYADMVEKPVADQQHTENDPQWDELRDERI